MEFNEQGYLKLGKGRFCTTNFCLNLVILHQGRLKIWTEHSTLILLISKPFDVVLPKFQHVYNLEKNEFSPNLEGVAQKMGPPRPFQFWTSQGRGSLLRWAMPFKFCTKRVPIEVNKWWKFGIDISNHFWEIEIWTFFSFNSLPSWKENSFWKVFSFQLGKELKVKNIQFRISQKWFEISTPNFHQLLTSLGNRFVPNMKALGALDLHFPPKTSKTSNGHSGPIFWATPSKFGENLFFPKL